MRACYAWRWGDLTIRTAMIDKINRIKEEAAAATAATAQEVEDLRIKFLSKKGVVSSLMADFRNVPAESKRELGQKLNEPRRCCR